MAKFSRKSVLLEITLFIGMFELMILAVLWGLGVNLAPLAPIIFFFSSVLLLPTLRAFLLEKKSCRVFWQTCKENKWSYLLAITVLACSITVPFVAARFSDFIRANPLIWPTCMGVMTFVLLAAFLTVKQQIRDSLVEKFEGYVLEVLLKRGEPLVEDKISREKLAEKFFKQKMDRRYEQLCVTRNVKRLRNQLLFLLVMCNASLAVPAFISYKIISEPSVVFYVASICFFVCCTLTFCVSLPNDPTPCAHDDTHLEIKEDCRQDVSVISQYPIQAHLPNIHRLSFESDEEKKDVESVSNITSDNTKASPTEKDLVHLERKNSKLFSKSSPQSPALTTLPLSKKSQQQRGRSNSAP